MNNIDKALLIQELDGLIKGLQHRALTMFETAKSKQRLRDIFELCDEPVFYQPLLQYRARTQPDVAATNYVASTPYQLSYRGFFHNDDDLEQALYQFPEYGWALLHQPRRGWQMWLIPAKNRTALISEWGNIQASYDWLEEQVEIYECLIPDEVLKTQGALLNLSDQAKFSYRLRPTPTTLATVTDEPIAIVETPEEIQQNLLPPSQLILRQYCFTLTIIEDAADRSFYHYQLKSSVQNTEFLDVIINFPYLEPLEKQAVFIAEQVDDEGGFYKYVLLLGYPDREQILKAQVDDFQRHHFNLAAIKPTTFKEIEQHWAQLETLYAYYRLIPEHIWQSDVYCPFIPSSLIQNQKFIAFDEQQANAQTPVLLLKERDKLRIIHGQKRMQFKSHELALPYLMLNREDGYSWQYIKDTLAQLSHPVRVQDLYQHLLNRMK